MKYRHRDPLMPRIVTAAVVLYFSIVGGATGMLIAVLILDMVRPGHPFYLGVKAFLHGLFG